MEKPIFADIVASAALAATVGGFVVGASFVVYLGGAEFVSESPLQALLGAVIAGILGLLVALLTALPAGILVGALVSRFIGQSTRHAALAGGITALLLFALAYREQPIGDLGLLLTGMMFAALGALLGGLCYRYVMTRAVAFGRN